MCDTVAVLTPCPTGTDRAGRDERSASRLADRDPIHKVGRTLSIMPTSPGALVEILTTAWSRIRSDQPGLPAAHVQVVSTAPLVGHVQSRWSLDADGSLHGLRMSTHVVAAGPEATVTALLHDAAHVLCWRRGLRDTTVRGYYHTETFLNAAVDVGLEWPADQPRDPVRGFADPVLSQAARHRHADDLKALTSLPPPPAEPEKKRTGRADKIAAQCGCTPPRRIWLAQSKLDIGPITCGVCGKPFT